MNKPIDQELLPCPFCGGKADTHCTAGDYPDWFVKCEECGASSDITGPAALHFWNRRAQQPAGVAVPDATGRTPQDYAIEHAEYMAVAAESVISDYRAYSKARIDFEDAEGEDAPDEAFETVNSTESDLTEALINLRGMIYEFRKRRDRATAPHPVSGEQKAVAKPQTCNGKRCGWCGEGAEPCHYSAPPAPPAPPAAQDVAVLVEALQAIYDEDGHVPHDATDAEISEGRKQCIYRIRKKVKVALAAHRAQQGEQS